MAEEEMPACEADEHVVLATSITEENRDLLVQIALAQYIGEHCLYCYREFATLEDLYDAVWTGDPTGYLAHQKCWDAHQVGRA